LKIIYVSGSTVPSRFANSVHVMKMCQAFAANGHEVVLYAHKNSDEEIDPFEYYGVNKRFEVKYYQSSRRRIRYVSSIMQTWALRKSVKLTKADLVYGRSHLGLLGCIGLGIPIIYEAHILPQTRKDIAIEKVLLRRRELERLVVISDSLRRDYIKMFPFVESIITVAHDGADLPVNDVEDKVGRWPGRLGVPQVGYVGHLYPGKGMEVVHALSEAMPEIDFHVIGGMEQDIAYWREQAKGSNLFFHGFVSHGRLSSYYSRFDIVLAPLQKRIVLHSRNIDISRWTSPLKIFEYMAHGKPLISSDLPVLREIVIDGHNGIVVPPDNIQAWIDALQALISNQSMRERLGLQARNDLEAKYTWQTRAKAVLPVADVLIKSECDSQSDNS